MNVSQLCTQMLPAKNEKQLGLLQESSDENNDELEELNVESYYGEGDAQIRSIVNDRLSCSSLSDQSDGPSRGDNSNEVEFLFDCIDENSNSDNELNGLSSSSDREIRIGLSDASVISPGPVTGSTIKVYDDENSEQVQETSILLDDEKEVWYPLNDDKPNDKSDEDDDEELDKRADETVVPNLITKISMQLSVDDENNGLYLDIINAGTRCANPQDDGKLVLKGSGTNLRRSDLSKIACSLGSKTVTNPNPVPETRENFTKKSLDKSSDQNQVTTNKSTDSSRVPEFNSLKDTELMLSTGFKDLSTSTAGPRETDESSGSCFLDEEIDGDDDDNDSETNQKKKCEAEESVFHGDFYATFKIKQREPNLNLEDDDLDILDESEDEGSIHGFTASLDASSLEFSEYSDEDLPSHRDSEIDANDANSASSNDDDDDDDDSIDEVDQDEELRDLGDSQDSGTELGNHQGCGSRIDDPQVPESNILLHLKDKPSHKSEHSELSWSSSTPDPCLTETVLDADPESTSPGEVEAISVSLARVAVQADELNTGLSQPDVNHEPSPVSVEPKSEDSELSSLSNENATNNEQTPTVVSLDECDTASELPSASSEETEKSISEVKPTELSQNEEPLSTAAAPKQEKVTSGKVSGNIEDPKEHTNTTEKVPESTATDNRISQDPKTSDYEHELVEMIPKIHLVGKPEDVTIYPNDSTDSKTPRDSPVLNIEEEKSNTASMDVDNVKSQESEQTQSNELDQILEDEQENACELEVEGENSSTLEADEENSKTDEMEGELEVERDRSEALQDEVACSNSLEVEKETPTEMVVENSNAFDLVEETSNELQIEVETSNELKAGGVTPSKLEPEGEILIASEEEVEPSNKLEVEIETSNELEVECSNPLEAEVDTSNELKIVSINEFDAEVDTVNELKIANINEFDAEVDTVNELKGKCSNAFEGEEETSNELEVTSSNALEAEAETSNELKNEVETSNVLQNKGEPLESSEIQTLTNDNLNSSPAAVEISKEPDVEIPVATVIEKESHEVGMKISDISDASVEISSLQDNLYDVERPILSEVNSSDVVQVEVESSCALEIEVENSAIEEVYMERTNRSEVATDNSSSSNRFPESSLMKIQDQISTIPAMEQSQNVENKLSLPVNNDVENPEVEDENEDSQLVIVEEPKTLETEAEKVESSKVDVTTALEIEVKSSNESKCSHVIKDSSTLLEKSQVSNPVPVILESLTVLEDESDLVIDSEEDCITISEKPNPEPSKSKSIAECPGVSDLDTDMRSVAEDDDIDHGDINSYNTPIPESCEEEIPESVNRNVQIPHELDLAAEYLEHVDTGDVSDVASDISEGVGFDQEVPVLSKVRRRADINFDDVDEASTDEETMDQILPLVTQKPKDKESNLPTELDKKEASSATSQSPSISQPPTSAKKIVVALQVPKPGFDKLSIPLALSPEPNKLAVDDSSPPKTESSSITVSCKGQKPSQPVFPEQFILTTTDSDNPNVSSKFFTEILPNGNISIVKDDGTPILEPQTTFPIENEIQVSSETIITPNCSQSEELGLVARPPEATDSIEYISTFNESNEQLTKLSSGLDASPEGSVDTICVDDKPEISPVQPLLTDNMVVEYVDSEVEHPDPRPMSVLTTPIVIKLSNGQRFSVNKLVKAVGSKKLPRRFEVNEPKETPPPMGPIEEDKSDVVANNVYLGASLPEKPPAVTDSVMLQDNQSVDVQSDLMSQKYLDSDSNESVRTELMEEIVNSTSPALEASNEEASATLPVETQLIQDSYLFGGEDYLVIADEGDICNEITIGEENNHSVGIEYEQIVQNMILSNPIENENLETVGQEVEVPDTPLEVPMSEYQHQGMDNVPDYTAGFPSKSSTEFHPNRAIYKLFGLQNNSSSPGSKGPKKSSLIYSRSPTSTPKSTTSSRKQNKKVQFADRDQICISKSKRHKHHSSKSKKIDARDLLSSEHLYSPDVYSTFLTPTPISVEPKRKRGRPRKIPPTYCYSDSFRSQVSELNTSCTPGISSEKISVHSPFQPPRHYNNEELSSPRCQPFTNFPDVSPKVDELPQASCPSPSSQLPQHASRLKEHPEPTYLNQEAEKEDDLVQDMSIGSEVTLGQVSENENDLYFSSCDSAYSNKHIQNESEDVHVQETIEVEVVTDNIVEYQSPSEIEIPASSETPIHEMIPVSEIPLPEGAPISQPVILPLEKKFTSDISLKSTNQDEPNPIVSPSEIEPEKSVDGASLPVNEKGPASILEQAISKLESKSNSDSEVTLAKSPIITSESQEAELSASPQNQLTPVVSTPKENPNENLIPTNLEDSANTITRRSPTNESLEEPPTDSSSEQDKQLLDLQPQSEVPTSSEKNNPPVVQSTSEVQSSLFRDNPEEPCVKVTFEKPADTTESDASTSRSVIPLKKRKLRNVGSVEDVITPQKHDSLVKPSHVVMDKLDEATVRALMKVHGVTKCSTYVFRNDGQNKADLITIACKSYSSKFRTKFKERVDANNPSKSPMKNLNHQRSKRHEVPVTTLPEVELAPCSSSKGSVSKEVSCSASKNKSPTGNQATSPKESPSTRKSQNDKSKNAVIDQRSSQPAVDSKSRDKKKSHKSATESPSKTSETLGFPVIAFKSTKEINKDEPKPSPKLSPIKSRFSKRKSKDTVQSPKSPEINIAELFGISTLAPSKGPNSDLKSFVIPRKKSESQDDKKSADSSSGNNKTASSISENSSNTKPDRGSKSVKKSPVKAPEDAAETSVPKVLNERLKLEAASNKESSKIQQSSISTRSSKKDTKASERHSGTTNQETVESKKPKENVSLNVVKNSKPNEVSKSTTSTNDQHKSNDGEQKNSGSGDPPSILAPSSSNTRAKRKHSSDKSLLDKPDQPTETFNNAKTNINPGSSNVSSGASLKESTSLNSSKKFKACTDERNKCNEPNSTGESKTPIPSHKIDSAERSKVPNEETGKNEEPNCSPPSSVVQPTISTLRRSTNTFKTESLPKAKLKLKRLKSFSKTRFFDKYFSGSSKAKTLHHRKYLRIEVNHQKCIRERFGEGSNKNERVLQSSNVNDEAPTSPSPENVSKSPPTVPSIDVSEMDSGRSAIEGGHRCSSLSEVLPALSQIVETEILASRTIVEKSPQDIFHELTTMTKSFEAIIQNNSGLLSPPAESRDARSLRVASTNDGNSPRELFHEFKTIAKPFEAIIQNNPSPSSPPAEPIEARLVETYGEISVEGSPAPPSINHDDVQSSSTSAVVENNAASTSSHLMEDTIQACTYISESTLPLSPCPSAVSDETPECVPDLPTDPNLFLEQESLDGTNQDSDKDLTFSLEFVLGGKKLKPIKNNEPHISRSKPDESTAFLGPNIWTPPDDETPITPSTSSREDSRSPDIPSSSPVPTGSQSQSRSSDDNPVTDNSQPSTSILSEIEGDDFRGFCLESCPCRLEQKTDVGFRKIVFCGCLKAVEHRRNTIIEDVIKDYQANGLEDLYGSLEGYAEAIAITPESCLSWWSDLIDPPSCYSVQSEISSTSSGSPFTVYGMQDGNVKCNSVPLALLESINDRQAKVVLNREEVTRYLDYLERLHALNNESESDDDEVSEIEGPRLTRNVNMSLSHFRHIDLSSSTRSYSLKSGNKSFEHVVDGKLGYVKYELHVDEDEASRNFSNVASCVSCTPSRVTNLTTYTDVFDFRPRNPPHTTSCPLTLTNRKRRKGPSNLSAHFEFTYVGKFGSDQLLPPVINIGEGPVVYRSSKKGSSKSTEPPSKRNKTK